MSDTEKANIITFTNNGKTHKLAIYRTKYASNGNLAVFAVTADTHEFFEMITVNTNDKLHETCACIDNNNMSSLIDALTEAGIATRTLATHAARDNTFSYCVFLFNLSRIPKIEPVMSGLFYLP